MQSLEVRVSVVEDDIRDVKSDLKELKKEMSEQDEKIERKIDENLEKLKTKSTETMMFKPLKQTK